MYLFVSLAFYCSLLPEVIAKKVINIRTYLCLSAISYKTRPFVKSRDVFVMNFLYSGLYRTNLRELNLLDISQ
jgi:hypothetical protein